MCSCLDYNAYTNFFPGVFEWCLIHFQVQYLYKTCHYNSSSYVVYCVLNKVNKNEKLHVFTNSHLRSELEKNDICALKLDPSLIPDYTYDVSFLFFLSCNWLLLLLFNSGNHKASFYLTFQNQCHQKKPSLDPTLFYYTQCSDLCLQKLPPHLLRYYKGIKVSDTSFSIHLFKPHTHKGWLKYFLPQ